MIYNREFVWVHFPKTAGTKTEKIFKKYFSDQHQIHQDPVGLKKDPSMGWHDSVYGRESKDSDFRLGDRYVLIGTRRLIPWLASKFLFVMKRAPSLDYDKGLLLEGNFLHANGQLSHVDSYIENWMPESLRLGHGRILYIRQENFAEEFCQVFGKFLDLSKVSSDFLEKRVNATDSLESIEMCNFLYKHRESIYSNCPEWSKLESIVYKQ